MKEEIQKEYVKRSQKEYSMSFKLQIVQEVEQGLLSASRARSKYGIQERHTVEECLKFFGNFTLPFK